MIKEKAIKIKEKVYRGQNPLILLHTRKDVVTLTLLVGAVVLPFLHLKFGSSLVDGFIAVSYPMEARNYVWYVCQEVATVIAWLFVYRSVRPQWKRVVQFYLMYCVYDMLLFFWCFNEKNYYYIPYVALLFITWKLFRK
jgi:hypothetical protein